MSKFFRNSFRPQLEILEGRCTPAGTVTGNFADGVWTLTGDGAANAITVNSTGPPGAFTVSGTSTTVNGDTNPTGVKAIVFEMQGGSDSVTMNSNATPIQLKRLTVIGGDGANSFIGEQLTVKKSLKVTNGSGFDLFVVTDFKVKKSVVIENGNGGSYTAFGSTSPAAGFNSIGRHLQIFNGVGADRTDVFETNIGGNVVIENGIGDGANAGSFNVSNQFQTIQRAVFGGDVEVTFLDGTVDFTNGIRDAKVKGNVTFNNGSGDNETHFDGKATSVPVTIKGNLTINGTGTTKVTVGIQGNQAGLTVGGNLRIKLGNPANPLEAYNLTVKGKTEIT